MPVTLESVKKLVRELEFVLWIADDNSSFIIPYFSDDGRRRIDVRIAVHDEGTFLQFTAVLVNQFGDDHQYHYPALRVINEMSHKFRFVKIVQEEEHSTVKAFGDHWILDGPLTPRQFHTMLSGFTVAAFHAQAHVLSVLDDESLQLDDCEEIDS